MNTKNRSTPVVEKVENNEHCKCGCGCNCDCGCKCNCNSGMGKTLLLCGTILVSAFFIGASVFLKPCLKNHQPKMHIPRIAQTSDRDIQNFIIKNPKVLIDSVEAYYKAEEAKAQRAVSKKAQKPFDLNDLQKADAELVKKIVDDKTNYSLGNKDGKFVIIEFFDYNCGWCKKTNKQMSEAIASDAGKNIRWILIDTPIFGDASELISRYVLAAGKQGKYAEMHHAVGEAKSRLDETALLGIAKALKLDTKKLTEDANGAEIKAKLASNNEYREKLNIRGVPMLIVDGHINGGALIDERLQTVVKLSADKK